MFGVHVTLDRKEKGLKPSFQIADPADLGHSLNDLDSMANPS